MATYFEYGLNGVSAVTTALPQEITLGYKVQDGGVEYVVAYNACTSTIPQGSLCAASMTEGVSPYSVTLSTTTEVASAPLVVGVCVHTAVAAGSYFWMATAGFPVVMIASNISLYTGAMVGPAADGVVITTDTVANVVGINVGDTTTATVATDSLGGRFFFKAAGVT